MLDRIKGLGTQVATTASDAAQGITSSIKSGAEAVASAATSASEAINEKAVRASTAQMCSILEIAVTELKSRPLSARPVSLTATVNFGLATLEMQIHLPSSKDDEASGSEADHPHSGA
jgi:hypothetical protein